MPLEILTAILGGVIGAVSTIAAALFLNHLGKLRRSKSIRAIVAAEISTIEEKAQRYVDGLSTDEELAASTPLLVSIAPELGHLNTEQVISFRRIVTLDMEMRKGMKTEKARATIVACQEAKRHFPGEF